MAAGDRIHCWIRGERWAIMPRSVSATARPETVFDLNVGDPAMCVANG
jgi:hypothetical protein